VVPAWRRKLQLKGKYHWGNAGVTHDLWKKGALGAGELLTIDLPSDPAALTRGLLSLDGTQRRTPSIEPRWDDDPSHRQLLLTAANTPQTLVIRGTDLWRNPDVFVGSQRAKSIEIMPDMLGIVATFDKVETPPHLGKDYPQADLTVVTSGGISTLRNGVTIMPCIEAPKPASAVELSTVRIASGGNLTLSSDPALLPDNYADFGLWVRPKEGTDDDWRRLPVSIRNSGATLKISAPVTWDRGWGALKLSEMLADLRLQAHPELPHVSVPKPDGIKQTFFLFPTKDAMKAKLVKPAPDTPIPYVVDPVTGKRRITGGFYRRVWVRRFIYRGFSRIGGCAEVKHSADRQARRCAASPDRAHSGARFQSGRWLAPSICGRNEWRSV